MTKPRIIIFNSISLDGRLDNTVEMGLYYQLAGTWTAIEPYNGCAMLSGSETMLTAFDQQENSPIEQPQGPKVTIPGAVPYMVVIDSRGRIQNWQQIQAQPYWEQTIAIFSQATPPSTLEEVKKAGIPIILTGIERVDLTSALEQLNEQFGIHTIRIDSGGSLNGALLQQGLVDEVSVLLCGSLAGPKIASAFYGKEVNDAAFPINLNLFHFERVRDNIVWLRYEVIKSS